METKSTNSLLSKRYISRIELLRKRVHGKRILHLGCSSGRYLQYKIDCGNLLHAVLCNEAAAVVGVDIDATSLESMSRLGFDRLYLGNAEQLEKVNLNEQFDIVVAGDLLEHLSRPGAMLDGVRRFLAPDGQIIISTINAFGLHFQIRRWLGGYREHFEHVCFYSPETLANLLQRHGYEVVDMYGAYTAPPHTWQQKMLFSLGLPLLKLAPVLAGTLVACASLGPSVISAVNTSIDAHRDRHTQADLDRSLSGSL